MKRLLAAGFERIYELSHAFRSGPGECSDWHQPEFTLLEWYRAFADQEALIADLEALLPHVAEEVAGRPVLRLGERRLELGRPFERLTVSQAFARHAGIDLEPFLDGDAVRFRAAARAARFQVADDEDAETLFFRVLLDRVEHRLGVERPTILSGYPAQLAALARIDPDDPRVCRRFECYVLGVELSNAFEELNDAVLQRRRFEAERRRKREGGGACGPMPEKFLAALSRGLPPAAGIALGVDRLLMLLIGAPRLADTLPFPEEV
jgi:lysyl-tRNA synthetase class 2